MLLCATAHAQTVLRVNPLAGGGATDGLSWGTAYLDLSSALSQAAQIASSNNPVSIWITEATYRTAETSDRGATFAISPFISIYGGFQGTESTLSQRPAGTFSRLTGDIGVLNDTADNAYNVLTYEGTAAGATATLNRLHITAGNANGSGKQSQGGGVYHRFGELIVTECEFFNNRADRGAALYSQSGSLNVYDSSFDLNRAESDGGGFYSQSVLHAERVLFTNNSATFGGGILHCCRDAMIMDASFIGNTASTGGGIQTSNAHVNLVNITAHDNAATNGGFADLNGSITGVNIFAGSNTANNGGAIRLNGDVQLTNIALVRNLAFQSGGGIHVASGDHEILNATIIYNEAFIFGGGVYANLGSIEVVNAIAANNLAPDVSMPGPNLAASGLATLTASWSMIEGYAGSPAGTGNMSGVPVFVNLVGQDGLLGTGDDELTLAPGTAGIDAAFALALPLDTFDLDNDGDTTEIIPVDVDGKPRAIDDLSTNDTNGSAIDLGASEATPHCVADLDGSGSITVTDLLMLLAVFGTQSQVADINQDGIVDVSDLLLLLSVFEQPCP